MAKLNGLGNWRKRARWLRPASGILVLLGLGLTDGCTRRFYRHEADKEVEQVLGEKDKYPAWAIEQFHVYPDPHARFADPTNPDRPPKPPDDPAAFDLAPNPQKPGHEGIALVEGAGYLDLLDAWDKENRAEAAERKGAGADVHKSESETVGGRAGQPQPGVEGRPEAATKPEGNKPTNGPKANAGETAASTTSLSSKPRPGQRPPYLLKLDQAVELGLVNSREYQDERENLYLTALPVTLERFSFATQFFAAGQAIRNWAHGTGGNNWTVNNNVGFAKLFPTGALMLFNFANQTIFNLTGVGRHTTSQSIINLDIVQPFLRGGGRAVTLEPLTQTERNLVYQIRNYARFREEFYVAIAGGGGGAITGATFQPSGIIAPPGFAPGSGIGGSGLVPGIVPPVPATGNPGLQVNPGPSGRIPLSTAFAAPVSGYLTTLLQAAQMRVDEYNIQQLEGYVALAKAMEEGGDLSQLQVDQFEQQLLFRRTTLLNDQLQYLNSLDQFKLQLGLPTDLPIELDDSPFRPLNEQFQRYQDLFSEYVAATTTAPAQLGGPDQIAQVRPGLRRIFTTSPLTRGTRFRTQVITSLDAWQKLSLDALRKQRQTLADERRRLLDKKTDVETRGQAFSESDQQRLDQLNFEIDLSVFEQSLREYESQPWKNVLNPDVRKRQQQLGYRYVTNNFVNVITAARNERIAQLRKRWPDLAKLCVDGVDLLKADLDDAQAAVIQHALINRMDLMNVRAQLVDSWRQLAIFANALLGTFNVSYALSSTTPPGLAQPLAFSSANTTQALSLNWELPLVRKAERNNYRASLINYQRTRRILQRAEDQVAFDTRGEIRLLRQQEENYRIQQRLVELGYETAENSVDTLSAPPAGGAAAGLDVATRAASLTQQLIQAQSSLYQAQFNMTTIWITYLNTRLQLYRDMELMPLDSRGVWIDEVATRECPGGAACGNPQPGPGGPGGGQGPAPGERPERLPEPKPVAPAQGPALEQAH